MDLAALTKPGSVLRDTPSALYLLFPATQKIGLRPTVNRDYGGSKMGTLSRRDTCRSSLYGSYDLLHRRLRRKEACRKPFTAGFNFGIDSNEINQAFRTFTQ